MAKAAVVVLADTESHGDLGRLVNALTTAEEFAEAGDEGASVFDGAGTKWVRELSDPEHRYHRKLESLKPRVAGACSYCAAAFGVKEEVERAGIPLLDEYQRHPSLRRYVADGYAVLIF